MDITRTKVSVFSEGPQDSMYSSPVAPSSGGLGNIGNSGGGGGGFKGGEAMMSTMAKMMAEAVSNQLASQFAPHQGTIDGTVMIQLL